MSSRKSRASGGGGGGTGGDGDNNAALSLAAAKKKSQAEKFAAAQMWAVEEKKQREAKAAAAAAAAGSTTKVAASATKRKRGAAKEDESAAAPAAQEAASASSPNDDDDEPVVPRSAKKRRLDSNTLDVKPAGRTHAEKMAAIKAEAQAAAKKAAAASSPSPVAKKPAAATARGRKQPTPPPTVAVATAASNSPSIRRPTRSSTAATASPVIMATTASIPTTTAAARVPTATATTKTPPRPSSSTNHQKKNLPFGSPITHTRTATTSAAAARRGEDTIPVAPRPSQQHEQQQQQGVQDVANALRGTATGSGGQQQQQEEAKDSDDDSYRSTDDSYYDSTDDDEELLIEQEEEDIIVAPVVVAEQQQIQVPVPPQVPVFKQTRFWWLALVMGILAVVFGIFLDKSVVVSKDGGGGEGLLFTQWLRGTVLFPSTKTTTNSPPCFADSPTFVYDDHVSQMVLVTPETLSTDKEKYCQNELPCPEGARCVDGAIDLCPRFFQLADDAASCRLSDSSNQTMDAMVSLLRKKSAAEMCRYFNPGQTGEMDWSNYEHNKGVGIFGIPSRRPLFPYMALVEELEELGITEVNLHLVDIVNQNRVEANQAPLLVVYEIEDDDGQLVIGLHAEQPVPRSSVCAAKHVCAWLFIIVVSCCMQLMHFVRDILKEYNRIFWEEPLFVGGATIIVIPTLLYLRRAQKKREARLQRVLDIVSIREEVVERLKRLAEQGGTDTGGVVVVDSQSLRDDIMWNRYSMSRAQRTRMERELWAHVVADIATDQRIQATQRVQNGQRRLFWSWRNSNSILSSSASGGGAGGFGTPVVSPPNQEHLHVRFQQNQ